MGSILHHDQASAFDQLRSLRSGCADRENAVRIAANDHRGHIHARQVFAESPYDTSLRRRGWPSGTYPRRCSNWLARRNRRNEHSLAHVLRSVSAKVTRHLTAAHRNADPQSTAIGCRDAWRERWHCGNLDPRWRLPSHRETARPPGGWKHAPEAFR